MENSSQINYNVRNLTFIRNNSYAQKIAFDEGQNCFFMMDYYNLLKERALKSEADGYMVLAGERKGEETAVAKRVMGIYTDGEDYGKRVFQAALPQADATTENPFLGIIQVYITDYLWMKNSTQDAHHVDINSYLEAYKEKIEACLKTVLKDDDIYQIYRTITSEDFCVVIRTSKFRKIYDAALKIMGLKSESTKRRVFFTYTNIGIELKGKGKDKNGDITRFLSLHESVREKNRDINFVLRFRIENEALEEIQALKSLQQNEKEAAQPVVIEDVNGMIGRYDLVVRLEMDEFMEIYPFLCLNITGYEISYDITDFKSQLIGKLVEKMKQRIIQTINTRVIMKMYTAKESLPSTQAASLLDKNDIERINQRRKKGLGLYKKFKDDYGTKFLTEKYRYDELIRMLDSLMNSYENLAYEIDTHINWFICSQYLEDLFESMITYMKHVGEEPTQKAIDKFLNEFQVFVSAFDVYLRLLQGINQNTIQAPRYDISAPIDGQKFLIAYSEFIDSIHEAYRMDEWAPKGDDVCQEKRRKEKTIIYPDLTIKNLELVEVFDYDRINKPEEENTKTKLLVCKLPMFEYFERPYDLIPLVSHEICHHMLVTDREKRNEYMIKRFFKAIAEEAVQEVQNRFVKNEYKNRADALTKAMSDSLASVLIKDFGCKHKDWKQYVFRHLIKKVHDYILLYFEDDEQNRNGQHDVYITKSIAKAYEKLFSELYENDESVLKNFHKSINGSSGSDERYARILKLTRLTEELLERVNDQTIKYKAAPITLKKLLANDNLNSDYYLLQWKKENESKILAGRQIKAAEKKQLIKNYLEMAKRIFALYTDSMSVQKDKVVRWRENLADAFAKEAKKQFEKFLDEDKYYYIYDKEKLERAEFWEFKETENAKKHYIDAIDCIEPKKVYDKIDFEIKNYREACADAAMCRWLGLDSFGYFRMSITLGLRMQGYAEQMQPGGLQRERLVTVLAVLATQENPGCVHKNGEWTKIDLSGLQDTIWQYIENAMACAKERIKTAMRNDNLDEKESEKMVADFFLKLTETIRIMEKHVLKNRKIGWNNNLLDLLFQDKLTIYGDKQRYFQKEVNIFKRLYEILDAYGRVQKNNILHVETEVLEQIAGVYRNMTEGKELHRVVIEVVNFYNDPYSEKKTNAQKMVDMLHFVQDYYYCNRIKKAEEELWEPGTQKV